MSEHENIIDENDEIIDDIPKIEEPIKKKTNNSRKIRTIKTSKIKRSREEKRNERIKK